jgi:hypothetical protein
MTIEQADNAVVRIKLDGRLDMQGTQEIDQRFAFATSTRALHVVVDLSRVTFLASIGLRIRASWSRPPRRRRRAEAAWRSRTRNRW